MTFLERLDALLKRDGISRRKLSALTGIPYTTIIGFYDTGFKNMRLSSFITIAEHFNVSLDYLSGEEDAADPGDGILLSNYNRLSPEGRDFFKNLLALTADYDGQSVKWPGPSVGGRGLRLYQDLTSIGLTRPVNGRDYTMLPIGADTPVNAGFAVKMPDASMQPYLPEGAIMYVDEEASLTGGDVGIFCLGGKTLCRQYYRDFLGNIRLLPLNRELSRTDISLPTDKESALFCVGRVIMDPAPPLPNA